MCDCETTSPRANYQGAEIASKIHETAYAQQKAESLEKANYANATIGLDAHQRELRGEKNVRKEIIADNAAVFKRQLDRLPYGLSRDIAKIKIDEAEFWALRSLEGK